MLWIGRFAVSAYQSKPYFSDAYVLTQADGSLKKFPTYGDDARNLDKLVQEDAVGKFEIDAFPELTIFLPSKRISTDEQ